MRLLELFSGSGSIGKTFEEKGWEVVSLDVNPKSNATIKLDIRMWDYTLFRKGYFDAIWASPCCTHYSCARRGAKTPRNLEWADSLVLKSLEIINYFEPKFWFIENPQTGLLKSRPFMYELPFTDLDYCRYCNWGYRKRTRIWTNTKLEGKLCLGKGKCENMDEERHNTTAQQGRNVMRNGYYGGNFKAADLGRIPPLLCIDVLAACTHRHVDTSTQHTHNTQHIKRARRD